MQNIELRAANPDNDAIIGQMPGLFESLYGQSFPFPQVYQRDFWKTAVQDRFISLVALAGRKVIGHVTLWADKTESRNVQLAFPAFSPDHSDLLPGTIEQLRVLLDRTAIRQQWRSLYHFCPAPFPGIQLLLQGSLFETAIFPSYLKEGEFRARGYRTGAKERGRRGHVAHAVKVFPCEGIRSEKILFVPDIHREIVEYLYEPLALPRRFETNSRAVASEYHPLPAEVEACAVTNFPRTGVQHCFIEPSLLQGRAIKNVIPRTDGMVYVFVEMTDPHCPIVCEELHSLGFRFTGVVPLKDGRESIVYVPSSVPLPDPEMFISDRAHRLLRYISAEHGVARKPSHSGKRKEMPVRKNGRVYDAR